jgi:hypothetical protein
MILAMDRSFDKNTGKNLPMFSRAGKSTVNMYIAFSQGKNKMSGHYSPNLDDSDYDIDKIELNVVEVNICFIIINITGNAMNGRYL